MFARARSTDCCYCQKRETRESEEQLGMEGSGGGGEGTTTHILTTKSTGSRADSPSGWPSGST